MKLNDIKPIKEWTTGQIEDLAESLELDFVQGPVIEELESSTIRLSLEHAVGRMGALKFEVFSKEHAPPHFRVSYGGDTANYSISNCTKLNDGLNQYDKNIRIWYRDNRQKVIDKWNTTRPSDCPVGPYIE